MITPPLRQPANDKPFSSIGKTCVAAWFVFLAKLSFTIMCCLSHFNASAQAGNFCIDYQYFPNPNNLRVYDFAILNPSCTVDLSVPHGAGKKAYAYISTGEIAANAPYQHEALAAGITFIAQNPNWDSKVVDLANVLWAPFLINHLALPAVNKGYDGFFLDTMDSYYLADPSLVAAQEAGSVRLVKALKAAYPTKKIITNRGFPVFDQLVNTIDGLLVEGLYHIYPGLPQDPEGTEWLLGKLAVVRAAGKPVYVVDYFDPAQGSSADQLAQQIARWGLNPLIAPPTLDGTVLAPLPPLRIEKFVVHSGVPTITFTALKGKLYSAERTDSIQRGPWLKIKDVAAQTATSVIEVKDTSAPGIGPHFYRLAVP